MSAAPVQPLSALEKQGIRHAILCTTGFLIFLPIGTLIARYLRTFSRRWFWAHWIIQFLISGPIILAGWGLGYRLNAKLGLKHFFDTHGKTGLSLLILYLIQITLGALVHFFKFPTVFRGHRAPHNYLHITVGIAIFIVAAYQVHYGLYTEWPTITGDTAHPVPQSAKHAWMSFIIIFWVLFVLGMGLLPRQFKQEKENRERMHGKSSSESVGMVQNKGTA